MQKAFLFFLAVFLLILIAYGGSSKEGFQNLMGVNWTSMNDGTPEALYTKLPIEQPKVVSVAEAGVGNIQPSPPPAADLPTAPFGQRSKEVPNPYKDPTNEPAKYIRLLAAKEDLQAFFAFDAPLLDGRTDPSIQIPLTRARADMNDLITVQSVMERNPGLPSRINNKQLQDIVSNLQYLRAFVRDLQNSGAIQPTTIESFADMESDTPANLKELQEFQIKVVMELNKMNTTGAKDQTSLQRIATLNRIKQEVDQVIAQLQSGLLAPSNVPIYSVDLRKAAEYLSTKITSNPIRTPVISNFQSTETTQNPPATLKQLQDFQLKVNVEIQRLSASGTNDPIILARTSVLQKIKEDVDQVIQKLQRGELTPETVPIYASDIEKAFPVLGDPTAPLPTILQKTELPPALSSLFPGGMSPNDSEQIQQINNVVSGYAKKFLDGASWQINLKYDNPDIESTRLKTAENAVKFADILKNLGPMGSTDSTPSETLFSGLPGISSSTKPPLQAQDPYSQQTAAANFRNELTNSSYENGLPGTSINRILPGIPSASFDWKERNKEIVNQIKRRGFDPITFGALPDGTEVSPSFSWRGHTQMMCMRLNSTADPGLAVSVGCPPQNWPGWSS